MSGDSGRISGSMTRDDLVAMLLFRQETAEGDVCKVSDALIRVGLATGFVEIEASDDGRMGARGIGNTRYLVSIDRLILSAVEFLLGLIPGGSLVSALADAIGLVTVMSDEEAAVYAVIRAGPFDDDDQWAEVDLDELRAVLDSEFGMTFERTDEILDSLADKNAIELRARTVRALKL